ncbi:MAG TPA: DUF5906 domain-containing protein [Promineifilum sp.]|nr:DUF5906 domain-containing protein [Promineifilum sp.]
MQDYSQAHAYVAALTGLDPSSAVIDVRMLHDTDKSVPGIPRRGTLPSLWDEIVQWNNNGYGVFVNMNELDGNGRELPNVKSCRTHAIDLDNVSAPQNYERATQAVPAPSFAVQSSPGKFHVYWPVQPYNDHARYTIIQRKLRTVFDGDKKIIDASRILRLPGTLHCKNPASPHLVTCWALAGYGQRYAPEALEAALASVQLDLTDPGMVRHDLGHPDLAAPSLEWLKYALWQIDPNSLDRAEWISITSAFKQSGWMHATEEQLYEMWAEWCSHYAKDDKGENLKQWNSIRQTQVGWHSFTRRVPVLNAYLSLRRPTPAQPASPVVPPMPSPTLNASPSEPVSSFGDILDEREQAIYFKDCFFVARLNEILGPRGLFYSTGQFNAMYGGKVFVINQEGKTTDEPWKAVTRSTLWNVPKVDDFRFLPERPFGEIGVNELGHKTVNTYLAPTVLRTPGDVTPFLRHMELMLPSAADREMVFQFMAHNAKFPGYKIPWAPLIQSAEGTGKGQVIKNVMEYMLGQHYVHTPSAKEMIDSGSQFNAWMRNKLLIVVDEIRTDERRDMIEVLKPWITDERIEIQAKGHDQKREDNKANWIFFSNYKDAIPISENSRRFAVFYSALQTAEDIRNAGMDDQYFESLIHWLRSGGFAAVADWFYRYPIEQGQIPKRAPITSCHSDVMRQSRGPVEHALLDAIDDKLAGFRGGYVSMLAASKRIKEVTGRAPSTKTIQTVLEAYGYVRLGRAVRPYFAEDPNQRAEVYGLVPSLPLDGYGGAQGYENSAPG